MAKNAELKQYPTHKVAIFLFELLYDPLFVFVVVGVRGEMHGQDFSIRVVPFVEQLGAHDTFSSSSSFTRTTHSLSLISLFFKQKRYVVCVPHERERETQKCWNV